MSKALRRGMQGLVGLAGGLGALLLQMSTASAVAPIAIQLTPGYGGPYNAENPDEGYKNATPGTEMTHTVALEKDGKVFIVSAYMSGDVPEELAPNQMKCSSYELTENGPVLVADQVYLTQNQNTDRPGNYTMLTTDNTNILFGYGYAPNGGNTRSMVRLIDEKCQSISETVKISNNDNQNIGAVHAAPIAPGKFFATYYSNNGNESRGRFLSIEAGAIVKSNNLNLLNPSNIGRAPVAVSGDRVLTCTGLGNNRPPEQGLACTYLNATTQEIIWKNQFVAEADPQNHLYYNQAQVVTLGTGRFAVMAQESNGNGKNSNDKGSNVSNIWILEPTDQAVGIKTHSRGDAIYGTHAALVTGGYSETGDNVLGIFEAPPTPSGVSAVTFLKYDPASLAFAPVDLNKDQWIVSTLNADSGKLSNLYGQNPEDQGRNYLHGIGNVRNPGFGKGFMPEAETLFVMAYNARSANQAEPKLAAYVSFLPGKTATPVTPSNPEAPPPDQFNPNGVPKGNPGDHGDVDQPAPGTPLNPGTTDDPAPAAQSAGACAFSPASNDAGSLAALGVALLGLAAARRRKES